MGQSARILPILVKRTIMAILSSANGAFVNELVITVNRKMLVKRDHALQN